MPAYVAGKVISLIPGEFGYSFNAETYATPPQAGQAFYMGGPGNKGQIQGSLQVYLPTTPGAFEVDVQESDIDVDAAYVTIGSGITTVNASGYGVQDFSTGCQFVRSKLTSLTNSGPVTAIILNR